MLLPFTAEIYFYRQPVDFRCQIDALALLVADTLQMNPTSGKIFIFRNKGFDRLKVLYYERNGFWLLYRRLEEGKFKYPSIDDKAMTITPDQLQWLLSGLDMSAHQPMKVKDYGCFY